MQLFRYADSVRVFFLSLVLATSLGACAVQYVSRYDPVTEASIVEIQRGVEGLLQRMERSAGSGFDDFSAYAAEHERLQIEAALLSARAQAIAQNSITAEQSIELIAWLENLETLHRSGIGDPAVLIIPRRQAEQLFVAMLKFELAKKRQFDPALTEKE